MERSGPLLEVQGVRKVFPKAAGELVVLEDIDLRLQAGEIVGLLGPSGSGKSTLLRSIAGLIRPTAGRILYRGEPVRTPTRGIAMVFQNFALFPWLTVLDNVELGLQALRVPKSEVSRRSLAAIDLIGLDGFESAYPRELSGGMQQRVGFARALVVDPTLLLMDEPFSALDVFTAETLRTDFLDLWSEGRIPIRSVLMVTHNIEEAVFMCDRVIVLAANPGRIQAEIPIRLPHPRDRLSAAFRRIVEEVYALLTARPPAVARPLGPPITQYLHHVSTNAMAGLLETVAAAPYGGRADLPEVADDLQLEVDELLPVAEALQMLGLAEVAKGESPLRRRGVRMQRRTRRSASGFFRNTCWPVYRSSHTSGAFSVRAPTGKRRACASRRSSKTISASNTRARPSIRPSNGADTRSCSPTTTSPSGSAWRMSPRERLQTDCADPTAK